ncbi:MAG: L-seryl-tRNA(Sec) selenium transferase [Desulfobacteraceae bacterium]|jgi:L-seryl-tRNA(Ser) seleniumtransferase
MKISDIQQKWLRQLPSVDHLLAKAKDDPQWNELPKAVILKAVRETLDAQRKTILSSTGDAQPFNLSDSRLLEKAFEYAQTIQAFNLKRVINATGVVVHTNLGRSCLSSEVIEHVVAVAGSYSNLEFDLAAGRRGSRYSIVEDLLCELTGAEAALVVNNNAGAVLLCLDTIAHGKEVVISRGELVEIGGSFRIPDVMAKSGAILKEIGTTNRTHPKDYEKAVTTETGLLLKVHTSNYHITGFTSAVSLQELVSLGTRFNLPVMEDLGSGNFIDLSAHGMQTEPTVQASVATGADVITFSGDKLLGGPQAGFIVGKKAIIDQVKQNPLTRALRIDKLTLAALEATLHLYRDIPMAMRRIPTVRMLTMQKPEIEMRASKLKAKLEDLGQPGLSVGLYDLPSKAGGGSLPLLELPSCCVGIEIAETSVNTIERSLRRYNPPIIGRIDKDIFIIDPRTIQEDEMETIVEAINAVIHDLSTGALS